MSNFGIIALTPGSLPSAIVEPAIAVAACRAGAIGVVNVEYCDDPSQIERAVESLTALGGGPCGIKCGITQVESIAARGLDILAAAPFANLVILSHDGSARLSEAVAAVKARGLTAVVETVDAAEAKAAEGTGADALIAKGHEAAGRVGDETAFVLLQRLLAAVALPVWVEGGIGPNTAAACLAAGAHGVVLESQLLLTRESPLADDVRARLALFDGTETVTVGDGRVTFRVLARPGLAALDSLVGELKAAAPGQAQQAIIRRHLRHCFAGESNPWNRLLTLGQDVAFAAPLARKYVTVSGVVKAVGDSARAGLDQSGLHAALAEGSPLASSHGTRYPILQGAMTRVSDVGDFALKVAEGGALPFLALALMRKPEIEKLLADTESKVGKLPWGVGILGFVPQQLRQEQLEVIERYRPPFALVAGGRPDQAEALEKLGIKTYLHVPSPLLLKSFVEMGSRRFIFEGKECGGHVGPRSSFVLWESMIETLLAGIATGGDASSYHVVFAGGIHDDLSAAMVAAMAAPLSARGVKVGVLLGTAYLFTEEAVSTGAIVEKFQRSALSCEKTVLLETGPGHAIRCIESPYKEIFDTTRRELEGQGRNRNEIREELELMNLGRLRIASKGVTRATTGGQSQLAAIPDEQQWRDGMYMIGQVAALHDRTMSIAELHEKVSAGGVAQLARAAGKRPVAHAEPRSGQESVAIIGMSCMFPKANHLDAFWENILNKVDGITEVPADQWPWEKIYDKDPLARDKVYSKWGGFLSDIPFDPTRYGIPPASLDSIDPMQLLILDATRAALSDAGYLDREFPREKTSVILANAGHGPITALYSLRSMLDWKLWDLDPDYRKLLENRLPEWTEDSFPGYLGNVTAGRIANRFDLGGINFSVDAACASSLAALYIAMRDLRSGESDMVLLSATDTHNQPGDYLSFSKVHALSGSGRCRTFDATADGIAISEGIATLVLKRVSDAERDGDRIYAVIAGIGGSSDGRDLSLTAPRPAGQMLSLDRAYQDAGVSPSTVGLVEAHGTGTVAGDKAEVEALKQVYEAAGAERQSCAIGSVKTMIGHTKAAAGLASVIKVSKALHHKVLPPTMGVTTPNPACNFPESPFYINSECRPWVVADDSETPRRAAVSAFGFGGTNFHAVLEEYRATVGKRTRPAASTWPAELFLLKGQSREAVLRAVTSLTEMSRRLGSRWTLPDGPCPQDRQATLAEIARAWHLQMSLTPTASEKPPLCLAVVANSLDDLLAKLAQAGTQLADPSLAEIKDPRGIYFSEQPLGAEGKVAFLFPGQGSQSVNMLKDLALNFFEVRQSFERADMILKGRLPKPLSRYVYPHPRFSPDEDERDGAEITNTHVAQPAIGAADLGVLHLLKNLDLAPDMMAGHSYGEYAALCAAGALSEDDLFYLSERRGFILGAQNGNAAGGAMAAVVAPPGQARQLVGELGGVTLANINAPNQCVIAGDRESVDKAIGRLAESGIKARLIPVSAAFHSPQMAAARGELEEVLKALKFRSPATPVYSNIDALPYPEAENLIPSRLGEHLVSPVVFLDEIDRMYADGARVFVEVGPGSVLTALTEKIIEGRPHLAVSLDRSGRHGIVQLLHALGQLAGNGVRIDIGRLFEGRVGEAQASSDQGGDEKGGARRRPLRYLVNSANIRKIDAQGQAATPSPAARATAAKPTSDQASRKVGAPPATERNPLPTPKPTDSRNSMTNNGNNGPKPPTISAAPTPPTAARPGAARDQVMIEFQRTMLEMTDRFISAQQNVMLAYLGGAPLPQPGAAPGQRRPLEEAMSPPVIPQALLQAPAEAIYVQPPEGNGNGSHHGAHHDNETPPQAQDRQAATVARETPESPTPADEGRSADQLIAGLIDIVSQRTGYPPEMLDPTLDLEADLGIDSIKRIEILNSFRRLLPEESQNALEGGIEKLAGVKTLQGIMDWIRSDLSGAAAPAPTTPPAAAPTTPPAPTTPSGAAQTAVRETPRGEVSRGLVAVVDLGMPAEALPLPEGTLLIVGTDEAAALRVQKAFSAKGGRTAVLVHGKTQNGSASAAPVVDLSDAQAIDAALSSIRNAGAITGRIYLPGVDLGGDPSGSKTDFDRRFMPTRSLFLIARSLAKELADESRERLLIVASRLGGDFASSENPDVDYDPFGGALAGVTKSLQREWRGVRARVVDFPLDADTEFVAETLVAEATSPGQEVEIGYLGGRRIGLTVVPAPLAERSPGACQPEIDASSVVLVTGGARGITAEICRDLAERHRPTFVIVGRTPRPESDEDPSTASVEGQKELKAAIISQLKNAGKPVAVPAVEAIYARLVRDREIRANLHALEKAGSTVHYYAVDVRDEKAFGALIDRIYDTLGTIDGVIAGAGVIEDSYVADKNLESFERVFETKIKSALTLADRLNLDALKFAFFFSSVVGRSGNAGQSDYVAANEVLNKLALKLNRKAGVRVASLMWGPWRGGMAQPELESIFAQQGWSMIEAADGRRAFREELGLGGKGNAEVLLVGQLKAGGPEPLPQARSGAEAVVAAGPRLRGASVATTDSGVTRFKLTLDTRQDRYLNDHTFDGIPVLPMAVALELMAEAAASVYQGWTVSAVTGMEIPAGIVFEAGAKELVVEVETVGQTGDLVTARVAVGVETPLKRTHFKATAELTPSGSHLPTRATALPARLNDEVLRDPASVPFRDQVSDLPTAAHVYETMMFHGKLFQGITKVTALAANGVAGELKTASPEDLLATTSGEPWVIPPTLLDSAMQLAGVWARRFLDITVLPAGFQAVHRLAPLIKGSRFRALATMPPDTQGLELRCDLAIYSEDGEMVILVEGLAGIGSKSLNRLASRSRELGELGVLGAAR